MVSETTPYISRNPGDLVTAEDWNEVQVKIKEDIEDKIEAAKEEIKETGVDQAGNADKFDNKTPKNWTDELDQRYAPKVHDHEGLAAYRRYFKRLRANDTVVLEHKLGRFPLAEVYELLPIAPTVATGTPITEKFYLYYHHEERDRDVLFTEDRGVVRWPWGTPLKQLLDEYQVKWEDDDSLGDVINDFLEAFFKPPAVDHIEHKTSKWIDEYRKSLIGELKTRDEWPDICWVVRPSKLIVGSPLSAISGTGADKTSVGTVTPLVNVAHLSYDTLAVTAAADLGTDAASNPVTTIDLMILLRS